MSDTVIRVENLGKQYRLGEPVGYKTLRDTIADAATAPMRWLKRASGSRNGETESTRSRDELWALKDVNFEVKRGEVVGIIGRNGAGKSTLLKILSRITEPTTGSIDIDGRVGSLLEVGTGFHPELTGRENIYLNGAILGMSKADIARKFDEIVAFSEIEQFLDTPVKRYSSGMYMRLAFAVAAHLEPEILIVDEVLAVGDAEFQKKCLGKMQDVGLAGRTVLFVSHNMSAVEALCSRVIRLHRGSIAGNGTAAQEIPNYLYDSGAKGGVSLFGHTLDLRRLHFEPDIISSGDSLDFEIEISAAAPVRISELAMLIYSQAGQRVAIIDLRHSSGVSRELTPDQPSAMIRGTVRSIPFVEGRYSVGLYVRLSERGRANGSDSQNAFDLAHFVVRPGVAQSRLVPYEAANRGLVNLETTWTDVPLESSASL